MEWNLLVETLMYVPTSISRLDFSNDTNNAIEQGFLHDVNVLTTQHLAIVILGIGRGWPSIYLWFNHTLYEVKYTTFRVWK